MARKYRKLKIALYQLSKKVYVIFVIIKFIMAIAKTEDIKRAVENLHNCIATHLEDIAVIEKFGSRNVWEGIVSVFEIKGHPKAKKCYAWSSPIEGSTKRRYYAVLHVPPVDSPENAVRASIAHDHKTDQGKANDI